jgi:hypothetical protein
MHTNHFTQDIESLIYTTTHYLINSDNEKYSRRGCCRKFTAYIKNSLCYAPKVIAQTLYSVPKKISESFYSWQRTQNAPINQLPTEFIQEIDRQNKCKDPNAPVALLLFAATDSNGTLSSHGSQQLISTFTKSYRVALDTIFENREIPEKIRIHGVGKSEDVIVLNCHGSRDKLVWETKSDSESSLTAENVSKETFEGVHPKTLILSTGCNTGFILAQKIADVTGLHVQAPIEPLCDKNSWIHECKNHGLELCCYNNSGENIIQRFISHQIQPTQTCIDPKGIKKVVDYQINQLHLRLDSATIDHENALHQLANLKNLISYTVQNTQNHSEQQELQGVEVRLRELQILALNKLQEKHWSEF